MECLKRFLKRWWMALILLALLPLFYWIAIYNEKTVDYVNNGFFTFWLSGRLQLTGGHPYSAIEWVSGHHTYGATWIPEQIFPYPLPLALIMTPLGLLPISKAYILWDVLAQVLIASCIVWLATCWSEVKQQIFVVVILIATVFNGNIYLGLMTGTLSALFLVFLTTSLYFFENRHPFFGGVFLACLALKPPFLVITALIGLWLLYRRNWKAISGIAAGGLGLLLTGSILDPQWVEKFRGVSDNLFNKRLGNQPTIISYTRLLCQGGADCAYISYAVLLLVLIGLYAWLIWKYKTVLSVRMVFSAAIALGVLLPPYIWSYDYALLIIPICFIAFDLIRRRKSYLFSALFLILLDMLSITGLFFFWRNPESSALTIQRDMWSIWVAILVLGCSWNMVFRSPKPEKVMET
jgi:hypothetical protein